jgi:transposase-like protein
MEAHRVQTRMRAIELFEQGYGDCATAGVLGLPQGTVQKWRYTYRACGREALLTRSYTHYDYQTKLDAVHDVVDEGASRLEVMARYGIRSRTPLDTWCRLYRAGGPDALLPKRKGRPRQVPVHYENREQELEARVRELELELEIQKRINALVGEAERI